MSTIATFKSVTELRDSITSSVNAEWAAKMLHKVPELPIIKDRASHLVLNAKDKVVLDIGCTGDISRRIKAVAKKYYGVDKIESEDIVAVDLDHRPDHIPVYDDVDIIICSEILEHLANPGYFLMALKQLYSDKLICITVPNAGGFTVKEDCEVVNKDHVAWYSYTTLTTLLTRYGFTIQAASWYNGVPYRAEGLIFIVR